MLEGQTSEFKLNKKLVKDLCAENTPCSSGM